MTRELSRAPTLQEVVRTSYHFSSSAFDAKVCLLMPNHHGELTPYNAEGRDNFPLIVVLPVGVGIKIKSQVQERIPYLVSLISCTLLAHLNKY